MLARLTLDKDKIQIHPEFAKTSMMDIIILEEKVNNHERISIKDNNVIIGKRGTYNISINLNITISPLEESTEKSMQCHLNIMKNNIILGGSSHTIYDNLIHVSLDHIYMLDKGDELSFNIIPFKSSRSLSFNIERENGIISMY